MQNLLKKFTDKTGVPVTVEMLGADLMYPKINTELVGRTGSYDIFNPEATSTCEWVPYTYSIKELAEKYEPGGYAALMVDYAGYSPAHLRVGSNEEGVLYGVPYYMYMQANLYRKDVYENAAEKANFKAKYGYDLAPPTTDQQLLDQCEFFTRKSGATLKGEALKHDLYGCTVEGGRFNVNDQAQSLLNYYGGQWCESVRDASGKLTGFNITKADKAALLKAMQLHVKLMSYCPPGSGAANPNFIGAAISEGTAIMAPLYWRELWPNAIPVEDTVPGAVLGIAPVIGEKPYFGCFTNAICKDSKNPEGAYWAMRYMTARESTIEVSEAGWNGARMDMLSDPKYQSPTWHKSVLNGEGINVIMKQLENMTPERLNNTMNFNSDAAGKIYEQQIIIISDCLNGQYDAQACVDRLVSMTMEYQKTYGSLPITEEK